MPITWGAGVGVGVGVGVADEVAAFTAANVDMVTIRIAKAKIMLVFVFNFYTCFVLNIIYPRRKFYNISFMNPQSISRMRNSQSHVYGFTKKEKESGFVF